MKNNIKTTKRLKNIKLVLIMIIAILTVFVIGIYVYAFTDPSKEGVPTTQRPALVDPIPSPDPTEPTEPTPNPNPNPTPTPNPEPETPQIETIDFITHTKLSGNAFESLEQIREIGTGLIFDNANSGGAGVDAKTLLLSTDVNRKVTDPSIEGIKVELIDENGNTKYQTYTDSSGNYSFEIKDNASYRLRFTYGQYNTDAMSDSAKNVKNSLKYNAQDYGAIQVGSDKSDYIKSVQRTSMDSKNEIMIALDYSPSMIDHDRFKNIQASAKALVDKIFENNDNISIGLVLFSPKAYVVTRPTDIVDNLKDTIDKFDVDGNNITFDGKSIIANGRNQYR